MILGEEVDHRQVVPQQELSLLVVTVQDLLLNVPDAQLVLGLRVQVQDHQPLLVGLLEVVASLGRIVLHALAAQDALLLLLVQEDAVEGLLDDLAHPAALLEVAVVDAQAVGDYDRVEVLEPHFLERRDGLVVGAAAEEDLGDPEREVLVVVAELNEHLKVIKASLQQELLDVLLIAVSNLLALWFHGDVERRADQMKKFLPEEILLLAHAEEDERPRKVGLLCVLDEDGSGDVLEGADVVPQLHLDQRLAVVHGRRAVLGYLDCDVEAFLGLAVVIYQDEDEGGEVVADRVALQDVLARDHLERGQQDLVGLEPAALLLIHRVVDGHLDQDRYLVEQGLKRLCLVLMQVQRECLIAAHQSLLILVGLGEQDDFADRAAVLEGEVLAAVVEQVRLVLIQCLNASN